MLKHACPEEILNQVQNDTFRIQHDREYEKTAYQTNDRWNRSKR
jgi:hypothetical protein